MTDRPRPDEALTQRLPLPLAQQYRRAANAKTSLDRHLAAYYFWEAGLKLLASTAVVEYAALGRRNREIDECLRNLARPAIGHWWELVRKLVPLLADAGDPGFAGVRDLVLGRTCDHLPYTAGLDVALLAVLEGKASRRTTVRLTELFDRLVTYRNREIGHGAAGQRPAAHYDHLGRALFSGVAQLFDRLDVLAGRSLLFIGEVRRQADGSWLADRYDLRGENARRLDGRSFAEAEVTSLPKPERVYLERSAKTSPVLLRDLHPLVIFEPEAEQVYFLNSRRGKRQADFLSYNGGSLRLDLAADQRSLLAEVLSLEVDRASTDRWAAASLAKEAALPAPEAPTAPRTLGDFELLSKLGQGGMGTVYRAWQPSLGRQVALKCLHHLGDTKAEARFAREIRALGRVEHPHLVHIFTSGSDGDQWFYAMELVEGPTLAAVCDRLGDRGSDATALDWPTWTATVSTACQESHAAEKPLGQTEAAPAKPEPIAFACSQCSTKLKVAAEHQGKKVKCPKCSQNMIVPGQQPAVPRALVEAAAAELPKTGPRYVDHIVGLVRQVAEAAHALHEAGIVHRDIKPGNVMLTPDGMNAVLTDLGLAQLSDEVDGKLTRTRQFVGTLRYASPEQVLAASAVDRRSDVYSLGVTLWELLTLRPIYDATDQTPTPELMQRIQYADAVSPRHFNKRVSRDLELVVLKCLEKDPKRRYGTAAELSQDLQRVQQGEPVKARPVSRGERLWRWCRRNPVPASLLLTVTLGSAFGMWYLSRLSQDLVRSTALEGAAQQAETFEQLNDFYSSQVVERAKSGVEVTPAYKTTPGTIPTPATLTIDFGEYLTAHSRSGTGFRLYSDWPFRNRTDGGVRDDFERQALERLRADPREPFYRFEDVGGRTVLRFATARVMKETCVKCHNTHPDSPKSDWKVGDVRGIQVLTRPLDHDEKQVRDGLFETFTLVGSLSAALLAVCIGGFVLSNRRRPVPARSPSPSTSSSLSGARPSRSTGTSPGSGSRSR